LPAIVRFGSYDEPVSANAADWERRYASADRLAAQRAKAHRDETPKQRKERLKRERLGAQIEASRRKERNAAGMDYDPRTAAGRREPQIENLGGTKRARSASYRSLLKTQRSPIREAACDMFENLWYAMRTGSYPNPRFEPRVDCSGRPDRLPPAARAKEYYASLVAEIGREAEAILYLRIIENLSYAALAAAESGTFKEKQLGAQFVVAVDAAATFFGLRPPSPIVTRMREAAGAPL
jgi:hypothetical protein